MKSCLNLPQEKKHSWQLICAAEKISLSQLITQALELVIKSERLLKRAIKNASKDKTK
jgi:hypothetical protein